MESYFTCAVYNSQERFSSEGCRSSHEANLDYDPYPCGVVIPGGVVLRWPVYKFKERWRTQKECSFSIIDKKIQKLIIKKKIYIGEDGALYDSVSKQLAVLPKELWSGECKRCGRCCRGKEGIHACKYLIEGIK